MFSTQPDITEVLINGRVVRLLEWPDGRAYASVSVKGFPVSIKGHTPAEALAGALALLSGAR
jgi:hypothetical protein